MKLFQTSETCSDIYSLSSHLKSNGIANCITDENVRMVGRKSCLWIISDRQFRQAMLLYENENYIVENPLSLDEMNSLEAASKQYAISKVNSMSKVLFAGSLAILALFFGAMYLTQYIANK